MYPLGLHNVLVNLVKLKQSPYVIPKFHRRSKTRFYKIFVEILCKHKFTMRQHFSDNPVGRISKMFSRYTFQLMKARAMKNDYSVH